MGQVAGNHFLTVYKGQERLQEIGKKVLWEGAQAVKFELVAASGKLSSRSSSQVMISRETYILLADRPGVQAVGNSGFQD